MKKPSQAEAKAISQMFSTSKNEKKRPFDPLADSIVEPQKKKKKKAIPSKKSKPTNLKVFMLDKQQKKVPKGEARKRLEKKDRVQVIKIHREMDSDELKEAILNTFKWVHSYSILTCESGGHSLVESDDQNPNGEDVVKRRGPLYLAIKDSDDYVVSVIFSPHPPHTQFRSQGYMSECSCILVPYRQNPFSIFELWRLKVFLLSAGSPEPGRKRIKPGLLCIQADT